MTPTIPTAYTQTPDQLIFALLATPKWTQERIAHEVGVSQATICRIRSGKHKNPRYAVVERLRHLALTLDDFDRTA